MKIYILPLLLLVTALFFLLTHNPIENSEQIETQDLITDERSSFSLSGFSTDTSKHTIPLDEILSGGPGKDGIPSINNPLFISTQQAIEIEERETEGLSVVIDGEARFYPYTILVWHEIVNDTFGETPVAVTFCPLCGSGIVFDRKVGDEIVTFGVSGYLWESNLLMFDRTTESLWSQAKGEAVVGKETGKKLEIIASDLISLQEFVTRYPEGSVLSRDTGHLRAYGFYPYGDYEQNDEYLFPVSSTDSQFDAKELLYVVQRGDTSIAFPRAALLQAGSAVVTTEGETVSASTQGGIIKATGSDGSVLPGYHEMWFSWAIHNGETGIVWEE